MSSTALLIADILLLTLGTGFALITLLANVRREVNPFFALFWLMLLLWHGGAVVVELSRLSEPPLTAAEDVMQLGFTATTIALYTLVTALVSVLSWRVRLLMFASIGLVIGFRAFIALANLSISRAGGSPSLELQVQPLYTLFYLLFNGASLVLLWQARRRVRSLTLIIGISVIAVGQGIGFLNPALGLSIWSLLVSAVGGIILSYGILREEIIVPLRERNTQVAAVRTLSDAITGRDSLNTVLSDITQLAADLLHADAVALFLKEQNTMRLSADVRLPPYSYQAERVGEGVVQRAMQTRQVIHLDDYARDWQGKVDLPYARETFGSVIAAPLLYGDEAMGVLLVAAERYSTLFRADDVYLLQLLATQASVAIINSRMFTQQQAWMKAVEQSRRQLETVLTTIESPVVALDRKFGLIFANPAARRLFSSHATVNERTVTVFDLLPQARQSLLPPARREAVRALQAQGAITYELLLNERTYLCHVAPLRERRIIGWVVVLNDVTGLKELDRMKSEMVRMTSHDLKNPLQAAIANLELLRDDLYDDADTEVRTSLDAIDKQMMRMNRIIGGILDAERLKRGRMAYEQLRPAELAHAAVDEMTDTAAEQQVALSAYAAENLPPIDGDAEQLTRALVNLVENAIKFTPAGGAVRVEVRQQQDEVVFGVMDTGVGINPAQQVHVFDRYFRANQKGVEHVSGTGLGLSLVKTVVENHRGRVWLDSEEGVGSTFFIALPARREERPVPKLRMQERSRFV